MIAPRCLNCRKPLKKQTTSYLFQNPREYLPAGTRPGPLGHNYPVAERAAKPEGSREQVLPYSWTIYVSEANRPRTKAECQRFSNHPIVSVKRGYNPEKISSFGVWDGESYQRSYDHFCTNDCAGRFAQWAANAGVRRL